MTRTELNGGVEGLSVGGVRARIPTIDKCIAYGIRTGAEDRKSQTQKQLRRTADTVQRPCGRSGDKQKKMKMQKNDSETFRRGRFNERFSPAESPPKRYRAFSSKDHVSAARRRDYVTSTARTHGDDIDNGILSQ